MKRENGYWKLNVSHLNNPEFIQKISTALKQKIEETSADDIDPIERWEDIKKTWQNVLKKESRKITSTKNLIISQLFEKVSNYEQSLPLNHADLKIYTDSKDELEERTLERARNLLFRSKARWNMEAERNTKYFYNLERTKSNEKNCQCLIREDGSEASELADIMDEQYKFYSELYASDPSVNFIYKNETNIGITEQQNEQLSTSFTYQEITTAARSLSRGKSPGIDGLPVEAYQVFWNEIGPVLYQSYCRSYELKKFIPSAMKGVLNLIPKSGKDSRFLKNLRPITLLTVDYKIVEKALAIRIQGTLDKIINSDQTGFHG